MSTLHPLILILCLGWSTSLEIILGKPFDVFIPVQSRNPQDPHSFFRTSRNGGLEEILCPQGHRFDPQDMICVLEVSSATPSFKTLIQRDFGNHLDYQAVADNCNSFYLGGYVMDCPPYMSFNVETQRCDYPLSAGCCEYREVNPDKLVE